MMTSLQMNRSLLNFLRTAQMRISFSSFSSTRSFYFTFVHYIEIFSDEGTKKRSMFRVGRCSLYRGLFPAKSRLGDRTMHSHRRRCSLRETSNARRGDSLDPRLNTVESLLVLRYTSLRHLIRINKNITAHS
jgi:hypothetical protein